MVNYKRCYQKGNKKVIKNVVNEIIREVTKIL